ncbi:MAG: copper homeostasis protein CutC [Planctomycetales bacterium]|nr:copper homeostasis protein CutC [Planctomycetales bacterium]
MKPMLTQLEVCVERVEHAIQATEAGATRLEYNSALKLDGLTPSLAACRHLCNAVSVPVIGMLRPHSHSFCYDRYEQSILIEDCQQLIAQGLSGVAFGCLTSDGEIDWALLRKVRSTCDGELVFHRALDCLPHPSVWIEKLIDHGVNRVLSSGGARTALEGAEELARMVCAAKDRIEILAGGGVRSSNAKALLELTGCEQLHGSFKSDQSCEIVPDLEEIYAVSRLIQ